MELLRQLNVPGWRAVLFVAGDAKQLVQVDQDNDPRQKDPEGPEILRWEQWIMEGAHPRMLFIERETPTSPWTPVQFGGFASLPNTDLPPVLLQPPTLVEAVLQLGMVRGEGDKVHPLLAPENLNDLNQLSEHALIFAVLLNKTTPGQAAFLLNGHPTPNWSLTGEQHGAAIGQALSSAISRAPPHVAKDIYRGLIFGLRSGATGTLFQAMLRLPPPSPPLVDN